jgi:hypothetical protein
MGARAMALALGEAGTAPRVERIGAELIRRDSSGPV